jgi:acyl carrier protein
VIQTNRKETRMPATLDAVRTVLVEALELPERPEDLNVGTALFGAMPELDSFGVLQVVAALEQRFDITIDDDEFGADLFETVGTLSEFVDAKLAAA